MRHRTGTIYLAVMKRKWTEEEDAVKTFAGVDELVSPHNMATDLGLIDETSMHNVKGLDCKQENNIE